MFTDTHCHIFSEYYNEIDIQEIIKRAKSLGVTKFINNGTDDKTNHEVIELSKKYPIIYSAIGIHPETIDYSKEDLKYIETNIQKIVAVGEIGLDYHYNQIDKSRQKELFKAQLKLALKYNKPVIVHSRDATKDTIDILKEFPGLKGVIHCFSGSLETAKEYIKLGFKLGMNGVITFKNSKFKETLKELPLEALILETDAPYLSPEPYRGKKNEPANIIVVAKYISEIKNISLEELSKITEKNVKDLFDI